ncbi:MAG: hypothetical protein WC656_05115 [Sulfurimonas sp.]|jgi:hypothetical protein
MNVSPDLSPSIKLMKPYFLFSAFFYLLSMIWLFFINPHADINDFQVVGWVHLYMIGFVMLAIFSAMAQLGAVVVETKHVKVNIFKYIWGFLVFGLVLILLGFYIQTLFLLFGGIFVLIAMSMYAIEFLLTLKNAKRKTSITKAMKMSNFFLLLGIVSGIVMALAFNGIIDINPHAILLTHTFGLVVGFVILLIMGISIILIPMFGNAKRISDNEFSKSFFTLSLGVIFMMLSPFFLTNFLKDIAYALTIIATLLYLYQLFKMTSSRAKVIHDIWAKSMYVGFSSFIIAFILLVSYLLNENELVLKLGMWILLVGFFGFLIIGNFYKIIPFLVWFQIYAPLIEERAVPMLHELLPEKSTSSQWLFSTLGLIVSSMGLVSQNIYIYYCGITLLVIGASLFVFVINKILKTNL